MTQIFPGNQTNLLNWYRDEHVEIFPTWLAWHALGYAEVDATLRSRIEIFVPSHTRDVEDIPLIIPTGARIYYVGFRTPDEAIIGTTGERLKVGTGHTDVNPNIAVADSAIAANSTAKSVATPFDNAITTLSSAAQYQLFCSNAGNTAAGNGVRISSGKKRLVVDICYLTAAEPSRLEQLGYPSTY